MRRWLVGLALVVALSVSLHGQTAPRLYWDHDGVNVTRFEYVLDGGTEVNMGLPTPVGVTYSYPLPPLAVGVHTFHTCFGGAPS